MRILLHALSIVPLLAHAQQPVKPESAEAIHWMSVGEMQEAVKKAPRPVVMDVYTKWCGPCRMLATRTFTDPRLAAYVNKHFYAVKFDAESPDAVTFKEQKFENPGYDPNAGIRNSTHQFTYAIANVNGRIAYPTVVYLNEDLEVIAPVQGYLTPAQIEPILKFIGEGAYKKQDYQSFQTGFQGQWGN
ncbi:MAG: DUF255 domain-containing protein [Flavobacteriales bacterium]|nr:DUF255 domain-containing protein [Flavobacteriales bacterium]MCB9167533.1 DUF255 domain-containing protein [Flavobacteriales bacterium]